MVFCLVCAFTVHGYQWNCTTSSNNDENVGKCYEREDGSGNACMPPQGGLFDFNRGACSGNIYEFEEVTP